jgi:crotonobetainyl-CoA:carnitine CoA-transferase CaiB-like acyl-CoA transferase
VALYPDPPSQALVPLSERATVDTLATWCGVSDPDREPPLADILVADFSRVLAGPLVGMTLGDLGADVVKVESPEGDDTRSWKPPSDGEGGATYYHAANRNKRSVVLDLKDPTDLQLARRLCERADVVVSNFRPGTLERFGLGFDLVSTLNPGVVYCEVSGFGDAGGAELPGYDPLVQALGGLMSITGPPGAPSKVGVALVDVIAGLYASTAVIAAVRERDRSGSGQRVAINLLHTALAALANQASGWLVGGIVPTAQGNVHPSIEPFATFEARDGELMICAGNDRQFRALVTELGVPALADDPLFATNAARVANRASLRPQLEAALAGDDCGAWAERLAARGVPAGEINDVPTAFGYASSLGLDVVGAVDGVRSVSFPAALSRTPATLRRRPPLLDEHGAEIRAWLQETRLEEGAEARSS